MRGEFDLGSDIGDIPNDVCTETESDTVADFGGELISDEGVDLNVADSMNPSHAEQFRGAAGNFARGAAEWSAENPPQAHSTTDSYFGQMALANSETLADAAYHGSAATMEAAINQHGISPSVEHNMLEIGQAIEDDVQALNRDEPISFDDGQQIFDGETGIDLTDERLQGYDSLDDVSPELLDEMQGDESIGDDLNALDDSINEVQVDDAPIEDVPIDFE